MSEEHAVQVRWRTPVPGTGYEKLTDAGWVPMTKDELDALLRSRVCVYMNKGLR